MTVTIVRMSVIYSRKFYSPVASKLNFKGKKILLPDSMKKEGSIFNLPVETVDTGEGLSGEEVR